MRLRLSKIPECLKALDQWVLWDSVTRTNGTTKLPYQINGQLASSTDRSTWQSFFNVTGAWSDSRKSGIGFVFTAEDPYCGIDLDGCRNPETGEIAEWAKEIINRADTYSEVSPSGTGVKLIVLGKCPFDTGKRKPIEAPFVVEGKQPCIEIYDHARYFAITGERLANGAHEPAAAAQETLNWIKAKYWATKFGAHQEKPPLTPVERATAYVSRIEGAVSGQGGHNATFRVACILVLGFGLSESEAYSVLAGWNASCKPEWSERELWHKVRSANKQAGPRCWLRDVEPEQWDSVEVPEYKSAAQPEPVEDRPFTTLVQAAQKYIDRVKGGGSTLLTLGIDSLDEAIGGGVEAGELIILAARPSHGKSAVALQAIHHWNSLGINTLLISEEMSALMLGKRTLQFASEVPTEHWNVSTRILESELNDFMAERADCYIAENCGSVDVAAKQIERAVEECGVKAVVVDYAQLLRSPGKTRYEQVTNTSIALRNVASKHGVVTLVLAQLSRDIESRDTFLPQMSDLKDSGQLEQDADVVMFIVWPWKLDNRQHPDDYCFFIGKNRNREISKPAIKCKFNPARQTVRDLIARDSANFVSEFEHWSNK